MQCENIKCKKGISNTFTCNKCPMKFCSNSCMIEHYFEIHQNSNENHKAAHSFSIEEMKKKNRKASANSIFIREGEFLKDIKRDSYFEFKNFEKVKLGKKTNVIGTGAFGDVYLVKNIKDGKLFAVKQMDKQRITETGTNLEVIRREIDIHLRLKHPNIIKLFSYHEDDDSFYLILEFANSGTLFNIIRKSKGLDESRAFKYFIQSAAAVQFIHEHNLIHRDIKPENLLIDENENIKLCDFGWCIELEIGNRTTFCGTIEYMAPEIIKEMPYDRSIDVWSLGVLLFELLHGYSPFRSQNSNEDEENTEIFKNIIKYNFKIDRKDLSSNCRDLITKLLTPQINQRIKTKDIFSHPWVLEFEKLQNNDKSPYASYTSEPIVKNITDNNINKNEENNNKNTNIEKNQILIKNVKLANHRDKIIESLQLQKKNSVQNALNSTQDFIHFSNNSKVDSLFDKVLTQVKDRNKDKRKKSTNILDGYENDLDKLIDNENKIILKVEREERQKSHDNINNSLNRINMPKPKRQNFEMLNEIRAIDNDLDRHINENNKKQIALKNKTEELSKAIDTSRNENYRRKVRLNTEDDYVISDQIRSDSQPNITEKSVSKLISSNNIVALHPKNYFLEEEQFRKTAADLDDELKEIKVKSKKQGFQNYNEELYLNQRGRSSQVKVQKNSAYGKSFRELDNNSLSKDSLYTEKSFDNNRSMLSAIDVLEKAQKEKKEIDNEARHTKSFWERFFANPFKCE